MSVTKNVGTKGIESKEMEQIKPLRKLLIAERCKESSLSKGGIVLPERKSPEDHTFSLVQAIGPDYIGEIKVGDTILTKETTRYSTGGIKTRQYSI